MAYHYYNQIKQTVSYFEPESNHVPELSEKGYYRLYTEQKYIIICTYQSKMTYIILKKLHKGINCFDTLHK